LIMLDDFIVTNRVHVYNRATMIEIPTPMDIILAHGIKDPAKNASWQRGLETLFAPHPDLPIPEQFAAVLGFFGVEHGLYLTLGNWMDLVPSFHASDRGQKARKFLPDIFEVILPKWGLAGVIVDNVLVVEPNKAKHRKKVYTATIAGVQATPPAGTSFPGL
jgi:hypothetical protein